MQNIVRKRTRYRVELESGEQLIVSTDLLEQSGYIYDEFYDLIINQNVKIKCDEGFKIVVTLTIDEEEIISYDAQNSINRENLTALILSICFIQAVIVFFWGMWMMPLRSEYDFYSV